MRTGILGGTFDPIHIGHLHTAECALSQLGLDRVLIVPAGDPWQKSGRGISPAADRVAMCRLAVQGVDGLEVDLREVEREGPTYTVDTLATFPPDEELYLILGADAAAGLDSWHRWKEVADRSTLVIAPRPGVATPDFPDAVSLDMGVLEISGTNIRTRIKTGRPWRFLVTRGVHDYVTSHALYAESGEDDMVGGLKSMES